MLTSVIRMPWTTAMPTANASAKTPLGCGMGVLATITMAVASRSSSDAGSISFHDTRRIWSARMRTKLQRIHVRSRNTNSAFSRNQTGPSHAGPGPAHAPRNSSAPRNDVPRTCAYSASWMIANFIPEVLDAETGDELRLGLEDVERRAVLRRDAGDDEHEERELADHRDRR